MIAIFGGKCGKWCTAGLYLVLVRRATGGCARVRVEMERMHRYKGGNDEVEARDDECKRRWCYARVVSLSIDKVVVKSCHY